MGSLASQMAKAAGYHVSAVYGARNGDFVRQELGADECINSTDGPDESSAQHSRCRKTIDERLAETGVEFRFFVVEPNGQQLRQIGRLGALWILRSAWRREGRPWPRWRPRERSKEARW